MALKNAERKITQDLTRSLKQENDTLKEIRPKYWFEKFFGLFLLRDTCVWQGKTRHKLI